MRMSEIVPPAIVFFSHCSKSSRYFKSLLVIPAMGVDKDEVSNTEYGHIGFDMIVFIQQKRGRGGQW